MSAKKIIAIVCVILAFCSVLGLNARLDYPQIQNAMEHVEASAGVLESDMMFLHVFADVMEDFDLNQRVFVGFEDRSEDELEYPYIIRIESGSEHEYEFADYDTAKKIYNVLQPMTWKLPDSLNATGSGILSGVVGVWNSTVEAIGTVVYLIGIVLSFAYFALMLVLDSVGTAWSLVEVALYILGFSITL